MGTAPLSSRAGDSGYGQSATYYPHRQPIRRVVHMGDHHLATDRQHGIYSQYRAARSEDLADVGLPCCLLVVILYPNFIDTETDCVSWLTGQHRALIGSAANL